jgi:short-subunit dehydrogenase involved in D-alanine esterification of teichoic acids
VTCTGQCDGTDFKRSEEDIDVALEDTQKSFEINLFGTMKVISAFLPLVRASTLKKVVAISSGMGDIGEFQRALARHF